MAHDDSIDALAAAQHGVVARPQLLAAGVPVGAVDRRLAGGRLVALHTGVYLVRGHGPTWPARLLAAVLAAGPGAVASHRAAAWLHGLSGIEPRCEVTVDLRRGTRLEGVVVHRSALLGPRDVEQRDRIPCTRIARTIIDLAAVTSPDALEHALDEALSRRLVTYAYVDRRLHETGRQGRKGAGTLARLLADRAGAGPRPESVFERRLFRLLAGAGLPLPVPQYEVRLPDGRRARLDFAYPAHLLALEADSYRHHSSRSDWARDHTRNRMLSALGWRVVPVTWDDLTITSLQLIVVLRRGLCNLPRVAG